MKRILTLFAVIILGSTNLIAQRISVYGTGTMFESLENPSTGVLNKNCNTFQFNCFVPSFNFDGRLFGDADTLLRNYALNNSKAINKITPFSNPQRLNYGAGVASFNWLAAKILINYRNESELLIDVSSKAYGRGDVKNEAISLANKDNIGLGSYPNQLLTNSYGAAYTQIAVGYSTSISDLLRVGVKLGYVSGINYSDLKFTKTHMDVQQSSSTPDENLLFLSLTGTSKLLGRTDSLEANHFLPNFKNPGLTFSAGVSGRINDDWEASLYIKDLGFINWKDINREKIYDGRQYVNGALVSKFSVDSIEKILQFNDTTYTEKHFKTSLPARLEGGIGKTFLPYLRSSLFFSMPLHYWQSDIALINDFFYKNYHFILQAQYNTHNTFQVGTHLMIKSPVCDFVFGSDNLLGTIKLAKAANDNTEYFYNSNTSANVNFGLVFKFGKCYYSENATYIPMDDKRKSKTTRKRVKRTKAIE